MRAVRQRTNDFFFWEREFHQEERKEDQKGCSFSKREIQRIFTQIIPPRRNIKKSFNRI